MSLNDLDISRAARDLAGAAPADILAWGLSEFSAIALSFSGAEDVVLIDMAARIDPAVAVFCLDTGRLHPETYRFLEQVRSHYGVALELLMPDAVQVQRLVRDKGLYSFYRDGHQECCALRKVEPLQRKLASLQAWVTGQRKDQSVDTRASLPVVQLDGLFSTPPHRLVKLNPLANWRSAEVWRYIRAHQVPYNPLHERGFTSIGCEPCTRAVLPNQHEREGRWWWENAADKECGLHAANLQVAGR